MLLFYLLVIYLLVKTKNLWNFLVELRKQIGAFFPSGDPEAAKATGSRTNDSIEKGI